MSTVAQREAETRARHASRAASLTAKANAAFSASDRATAGIECGQPILVGHHSEGRHRRALERSHDAMSRGVEASKAAKHHADLAEGGCGTGIRIADDDAVAALEAKLAEAVAAHARLKAGGATGFYLTNSSANVRRLKARVAEAKAFAAQGVASIEIPDVGVDYDDGRILLTFGGKPADEVREALKRNGWKWSGSRGAWSRLDTPNARNALRRIASEIGGAA